MNKKSKQKIITLESQLVENKQSENNLMMNILDELL